MKKTLPHLQKSFPEIKERSTDTTPVFILGMPRSGTTLVEQIISSHSEVIGAGELIYIPKFGGQLALNPEAINNKAIFEFREQYLSRISKLSKGKQYVTDKMPHNFRFVPLICGALPEAKIVHVQRNATATCWSNFKQAFNSLLANKLRSSLTLLALVIGVFSVTVSTTSVAVLDNFFTNTMSILGSDVVTVQRTPAIQTGRGEEKMRNRKKITFEDAERLQKLIKIGEGVGSNNRFSFNYYIS